MSKANTPNTNYLGQRTVYQHPAAAFAKAQATPYVKPQPTVPAGKPYKGYDPLLLQILRTKRPTKDEKFCIEWFTDLLDHHVHLIEYNVDKHNNVIVEITDEHNRESHTCFTSHTDTVHSDHGFSKLKLDGSIVSVEGGGVLGADCGTGIYIMLKMIQDEIPGHYVFFASEERGRLGSSAYDMPKHIKAVVSFDRKGYDNLITHQSSEQGCSDEYADALIAQFKSTNLTFEKDPTGVYTDSYTFFDFVPECINLSVGYFQQHTQHEYQDVEFLNRFINACTNTKWDELPIKRDPDTIDEQTSAFGESWDIEDWVYENPAIAAELLIEYGITLKDCRAFERAYGSVLPGKRTTKDIDDLPSWMQGNSVAIDNFYY